MVTLSNIEGLGDWFSADFSNDCLGSSGNVGSVMPLKGCQFQVLPVQALK